MMGCTQSDISENNTTFFPKRKMEGKPSEAFSKIIKFTKKMKETMKPEDMIITPDNIIQKRIDSKNQYLGIMAPHKAFFEKKIN